MRRFWILAMVALAVAIILLPRLVEADGGANCWSLDNCGEVREGLVCPLTTVEMKTPVKMPITFGTPAPRVAQSK